MPWKPSPACAYPRLHSKLSVENLKPDRLGKHPQSEHPAKRHVSGLPVSYHATQTLAVSPRPKAPNLN